MQWASEEMEGDRELCTAAVTQNGAALQWASEELRGDRALCMAAVPNTGNNEIESLYQALPESMQSDDEIAVLALKRCDTIMQERLSKQFPEIIQIQMPVFVHYPRTKPSFF